jgi:pimeloyl-ACP methyl ester carboxylesterase
MSASKAHSLSTNHTYTYIHHPPTSPKPTILLLHGFPSTSYDWRHQIAHFTAQGYGILAPDLLGYGRTSKPIALAAYKTKSMASEIIEILDHEGISKVHGVGHDTGCTLLSRLADYFPERLLSCSFLDVPYMKPGVHFDLETVNTGTRSVMGFERFGYLEFFVRDEAGDVLDRFVSILGCGCM